MTAPWTRFVRAADRGGSGQGPPAANGAVPAVHAAERTALVAGNDWSVLSVPELGSWSPTLGVSVVIPAYRPPRLALTLAALSAQTYPPHLLEVVVVDDGSKPPLELPELRPENTRVVPVRRGWGPAIARKVGADAADGDVLHWLDADMVAAAPEVEAHLRWLHTVDYAVVLGHKMFAPADALDHLTPDDLAQRLRDGADPVGLARGPSGPSLWVEEFLTRTDDLRAAGPRAMRVHTGASASVGRDLYVDAGGMPTALPFGEDIALGYRLREAGAVFVHDREAVALHLGESTVMRREDEVNRHNRPYLADLVPEFRGRRGAVPRSFTVPYLEVVLPLGSRPDADAIRAAVDGFLGGPMPDVVVSLVAPWDELTDERRTPLDDPLLELRLVHATYRAEPRIRLVPAAAVRSEATFRLTLPSPAMVPTGRSLSRLVKRMEREHLGVVVIVGAEGSGPAVLTRTAAVARAARVAGGVPSLDLVRAVYPGLALDSDEAGLAPAGAARPRRRGN